VILPNGFDLDRFRPDPAARRDVRTELNLPPDALLIGHLGRWHPAKDYRNLISAVAQARSRRHGVRLVLAGRGLDPGNPALARLIDDHGLTQAVHRLGFRSDTPRLLAGLDLAVSSSAWEGFPNFIGEAMSCGVPPAATDAGDTAELVGDAGRVVPVRDARALAGAIDHLLAPPREERAALGRLARRRIRDHFELDRIAGRYQDLYHRLTRLRGRRMD
jgi:glycosyltransferase involved in cell wall biosynthesis